MALSLKLLDTEIQPFYHARQQLSTIPGVNHRIAEVIIAEMASQAA